MRRNALSVAAKAMGLMCSIALAYDPGTHVYIASKTFDIWDSYDQEFYDALMLPDTSLEGFTVRKFYYIGATLPDLLLPAQMSAAGGMLSLLHSFRADVRDWYYACHISLDGPLSITDTTYANVAVPITYREGELPMNSNFPKVCQMVQYARARGWTPKYKALIYGCYIHMIQDLYEGMALLPSRFGYGLGCPRIDGHSI